MSDRSCTGSTRQTRIGIGNFLRTCPSFDCVRSLPHPTVRQFSFVNIFAIIAVIHKMIDDSSIQLNTFGFYLCTSRRMPKSRHPVHRSQRVPSSRSLARHQRGVTYPNVRELVNCRYKHCSFRTGARDAAVHPRPSSKFSPGDSGFYNTNTRFTAFSDELRSARGCLPHLYRRESLFSCSGFHTDRQKADCRDEISG